MNCFSVSHILIPLLMVPLASCQQQTETTNPAMTIIENYHKIEHLDEILSMKEFEKKVIYIDIWGTGCSPCIAESKFLPELKKRYQNKDVAFVYLAKPYGFFRISR